MSNQPSFRSYGKRRERSTITLVEKACGHFGFIKSQYPQNHVSCTQCGMKEHDPERLFVSIVRKKSLENTPIPEMSSEELSLWIKQQLEGDDGKT